MILTHWLREMAEHGWVEDGDPPSMGEDAMFTAYAGKAYRLEARPWVVGHWWDSVRRDMERMG